VIDGYATMFWEVDAQLRDAGARPPELAVLQVGVGGLAAAGTRYFRWAGGRSTLVASVEPASAACALASIAADRSTAVSGPFTSRMVGLNAGALSAPAWRVLQEGIDLALAIEDDWEVVAQRHLHEAGIPSGETGAAGLAGLLALRDVARQRGDAELRHVRSARSGFVVVTEGETGGPT
jgi:diaminopropionate ammonia-lyase